MLNQVHKLHKVSLDRNTHTQRSCIDRLMKMCDQGSQEPNPVFPLGAVVNYLLVCVCVDYRTLLPWIMRTVILLLF